MVAQPRLALSTDPAENKAVSCKPELGGFVLVRHRDKKVLGAACDGAIRGSAYEQHESSFDGV